QFFVARQNRIDDASTEQARCAGAKDCDPATQILQRSVRSGIDGEAHVDNGNEVEVGEAVQHQAARMVVRAPEDDVTSLECVSTLRLSNPTAYGDDAGAESHLGDLSSYHIDLGVNRVRVTALG